MQRTLAYALSPAPALPLGFLLSAPVFGVLAALLLLQAGEAALVSRWSGATLAATHLITLGYLGLAMAGSMLQLIPVITGAAVAVSRAAALALGGGLAGGALLLAFCFATNATAWFPLAGAVLAAAFAVLLWVAGRALLRPVAAAARAVVGGMRIALGGLAVTVALGLMLALAMGGKLALPVLILTDVHAAWGLVGWVTMLVVGVAFQIIPMFQSSRLYPPLVTRWGPRLLCALLVVWSAAWLSAPAAAPLATLLLATALAGFAALTWSMMAARKRKELDATTLYWRLALGSLAGSALLACLAPQQALAIGIVFLGGFAMGVVNGMLYKIVPFLLWYHLQNDERARRGEVPPVRQILDDGPARRQFWWHGAALAMLLGALWWPPLARAGAAVLGVACVLLLTQLWRAALKCRRVQRAFQPS